MTYAHAVMQPNDSINWSPDATHTALVHVFAGAVSVNGTKFESGQMVVFERSAGEIRIEAEVESDETAQLLIIGGAPLNEPIVRYGPFVMNTRQQIVDAITDFQAGRLVK
jgi:redox-sensitive bicupin YhaK (pirin superfamily)